MRRALASGILVIVILFLASRAGIKQTAVAGDAGRERVRFASMQAQRADDCSWQYVGDDSSRGNVKIRTISAGANYLEYSGGNPITVDQWFALACTFDAQVPSAIPERTAIENVETTRVTLRGYLLTAYFKRDGDHDIHLELSATPDWDSEHMIAEVPGGEEYCKARRKLWKFIKKDIRKADGPEDADTWVLRKPIEIVVTGYVFLDANHAEGSREFCITNGDRGLHRNGTPSKVRGLWELHPAIAISRAE